MTFGSPILLVSLLVPLAALACYLWIEKRPPRAAVSYPNLAVLAGVASRTSWRRHLIAGLLLLAVALLCVAVARPRMTLAAISDRATVVLVVDVSTSMNATDVAPSRLEAARRAISLVRGPRAEADPDRPRGVLRRPRRPHSADDRPAGAAGRNRSSGSRFRHGDRRCGGPGRRARSLVDGGGSTRDNTLRRPAWSCSSPTAPRPEACCSRRTERDSPGRRVCRCTRSRSGRSEAR